MTRINKVVLESRPHPHARHSAHVLIEVRDIAFEQPRSDKNIFLDLNRNMFVVYFGLIQHQRLYFTVKKPSFNCLSR